jgi:maltose alpha-D-glucosyltransferase/alpha-amylase
MKSTNWLSETTIYQIFPASFQDSNGDGIGDLNGITSRLDYIKSLGAETIWLSPIHPSPFRDAGYDVCDYYAIAPRYGTMADFERLLKEVHGRGMRLLIDLVPGHTSSEHPWFIESCKHERNRYSDRYIWTDTTFQLGDGGTAGSQFINGHAERDGNYMANFFYFQPALNYGYADADARFPWQLPCDHPAALATRAELSRIMRFWLDKGVDGFRVDMAGSLIKGRDPAKVRAATMALWEEVRQWWDRDYPDAVLLSEWSDPSTAIETGFHVDFMIHFNTASYMTLYRAETEHTIFAGGGTSYFSPNGGGEVQSFLRELMGHLAYIGDRGWISIPTGNHDLPRFANGRSNEELKLILTFLFTLPIIPTVYYGDEIGLRPPGELPSKEGAYRRTGARTPMQWDDNANGCGFSSSAPEAFYLPMSDAPDRATVAKQEADPESLLHLVRRLIRLRKEHPALGSRGTLQQLSSATAPYPLVYLRSLATDRYVIAINALNQPTSTVLHLPVSDWQPIHGNAQTEAADGKLRLNLAPLSACIGRI